MRPSARSTELRRAGFTLLETMIAATILAVVLVVALTQMGESTQATKLVVAQSDLRRQAETVLEQMVRDLRSTQTRFVGGSNATVGRHSVQFYKVKDYDAVARQPALEAVNNATVAPPTATLDTGPLLYEYAQTSRTLDAGRTECLEYKFQTRANFATAAGRSLAAELVPASAGGGFTLTPSTPFRGLISALVGNADTGQVPYFADAPTALTIRLAMRRRIGQLPTGDWFATIQLQTQVELRPSENYR